MIHRKPRMRIALLAVPLMTASCILSDENRLAKNEMQVTALSAYVHRGMLQNEEGVVQGEFTTGVPLKDDATLTTHALVNVDLSNDTGDAWMPPGHAGEPTEVDLSVAYGRTVDAFTYNLGFISYVLANGKEFQRTVGTFDDERGETKELFLDLQYAFDLLTPFVVFSRDIDEADGTYISLGAFKGFDITEGTRGQVRVAVASSDEKHSLWAYGTDQSGISDVRLEVEASRQLDKFTSVHLGAGYSTIIDSDLSDWFDVIGVDTDNLWFFLGGKWSF